MNLGIIAVLCVFDVVFAIAVIVWNLSNKNRCKDNVEEVIECSKEKVLTQKEEKEEVIEKPVRIKDAINKVKNEEPESQPEPKETVGHHAKKQETKEEPIAKEETVAEKVEVVEEIEEVEPTIISEPIEQVEEPVKEEPKVVEKPVEKVVEEKKPAQKSVEPKAEPIVEVKEEPKENAVVVEEEQEETNKEEIIRLTFAEKLMSLDEKVQAYYNQICNFFYSYRNVNRRLSNAYVSFRNGRDLVAKLSVRGKTMKLHLDLKISDYDESLYFQKDYSDVKQYAEVPFTVKIKSDRGLKRALELISALMIEKKIDAKTRFTEIDALAEVKEKLEKE